ncbi:apolipoprotein L3-like isoform X1 [Mauremys mutica]|uniref:apolipoprotein L3-like isoform X1 n=1 Tax=Mauremys mutica TaxID=74926 RepID=UPI001D152733|nr:apolipoprotein L3-like isoform X1 [Mauremys mutica]XP_044858047.1 apolipoprotein L3-like isoform X1 [Mauremys mutica]XP_044858048.1 apolipoprotein L3-like isoform X1 [Mauremys mutica]XP_044858049.1 apolipoprotein L3-like isoform X1 [Mauremys mutica]
MQRVFSSRMSSGASSISEENLDDDLEISKHLRRILMDKFVTDWNADDFMVRQALLYLKRNRESIRDFLKQFPEQRKKVESCIRCLEEMVDNVDEVHKKCTTISAAANTMGLISGFFNLVKRGGRLCLGLEVFGDVANISRVIYKIHNSKIKDKVGELLQQYENSLNYLKISNEEDCGLEGFQKSEALGNQMMDDFISAAGSAQGLYRNIRELNKSTQQKANPSSGSEGRSSTNTTRQRKAKESDSSETPPAASKGNWQDIVIATPAIINKACVVKEDFTHLAEGGKGETGAEIRKIAEKLKLKLEAISLLYTVYMELIDRAN